MKNEEGRRWIKYRQDHCRNDCDGLGESVFPSVKLGENAKDNIQNGFGLEVALHVRSSTFAISLWHRQFKEHWLSKLLTAPPPPTPHPPSRFVSSRQHRRGRASVEGGVPPLVLLHDAVEEPVRPLQQTGALHRPLRVPKEDGGRRREVYRYSFYSKAHPPTPPPPSE